MHSDLSPIRIAATTADVAQARLLFQEYAASLAIDLCFQGFAEELAGLPGAYAPPHGLLMLAGPADAAIGCVALRPLAVAGGPSTEVGEIKRLYLRPQGRGTGLGRRLAEAAIDGARRIGYRELKLDTLLEMVEARGLYVRLGFRECAPYYHNPIAGAVYMTLAL